VLENEDHKTADADYHSLRADVRALFHPGKHGSGLHNLLARGLPFGHLVISCIVWTPVGISEAPFTQTYNVLKRESASAGLETRFQAEFKDFYTHVGSNFEMFKSSARALIDRQLRVQNRDISKIVDSAEYDYIIMTRIALNIALGHGPTFAERVEMLTQSYEDQMAILLSVYQWEDSNQDLVKDESEVNKNLFSKIFLFFIELDIIFCFLSVTAILNRLDIFLIFYTIYFNLVWIFYLIYYYKRRKE